MGGRGNNFNDEHHILHHRQEWELREDGKKLRDTLALRPVIFRGMHNEIHRDCPPIPLLGYHALAQVRKHFQPTFDTFETIDRLCFAIEKAGWHERSHPIERDLGELAIEAIRLQIPYIQEGIMQRV